MHNNNLIREHSNVKYSPDKDIRVIDEQNTIVVSNKEHNGSTLNKFKRLFRKSSRKK